MTDLAKPGLGMADDKTFDGVGSDEVTLPSVPLDDVEGKPKGRTAQLLSVLISGVALFSDGYNIQVTAYTNTVLTALYPVQMTTVMKTRLTNSLLIGDIFGMLFFGIAADRIGRRWGIIGCTVLLVGGVILATAAHGKTVDGMLWMMVIGRGVAGVGAGGEYAVCTTSSIEAAEEAPSLQRKRGMLVAWSTNVAIISGFVASALTVLVVLAAYGRPSDGVWRIGFGIGAVLPLAVFGFRLRMMNSKLFEKHAVKGRKFPYRLALKRYWRPLLGCSGVWFLYNMVVYPFNLLAPTLVAGFADNQTLIQSNGWSALVNSFALPGAIFGSLLIDRMGPRQTYAFGLVVVACIGFTIGGAMVPLRTGGTGAFAGFVILFGLFQCFLSVGPGNNNFVISSESFPTPIRGHALGFAAAMGKTGAAVGTQIFPLIRDTFDNPIHGQRAIFLVGSGICALGAIWVMALVPNRRAQLEDEDVLFKEYLEANGWDVTGSSKQKADLSIEKDSPALA